MEEFSDRGGKSPVVVDLCLQLIYCVLQTSYSETFELVPDMVSLGGCFLKGLGGGGLPALGLPWCPFFSILCVLVTGPGVPTSRVEEMEMEMEMERW